MRAALPSSPMPPPSDVFDVVIVGAGPAGLFAAFYAGMRNLRTLVLEGLPRPGGQITALYPEKYIYDVGGQTAVLGRDLVAELYKQAAQFGAEFRFDERVERLEVKAPGDLRLTTARCEYRSRTAILCAGLGAFRPNRLEVPGARALEGRGVGYVVGARDKFLGRRVLVVGGGDTAVDWALELRRWAREVILAHRLDYFEAHQHSVLALGESGVRVLTLHQLEAIEGKAQVERAILVNARSGEKLTLPVDDVLVCIGFKADLGPIKEWGLKLAGRTLLVSNSMETNLPGVFAAGDIAVADGALSMNLIASGFGQATMAVGCANRFIHPRAQVFHGHSSQRKGMKYLPTPGAPGEHKGEVP